MGFKDLSKKSDDPLSKKVVRSELFRKDTVVLAVSVAIVVIASALAVYIIKL